MNRKILTILLILALIPQILTACNNTTVTQSTSLDFSSNKNPSDYTGTINIWEYSDELMQIIVKEFNKVYPNVTVNLLPVDGNSYDQKLQTALTSGTEVPDIIWLNYFQRGKLHSLDILDNLSLPPYSVDKTKIQDWVVMLGENEKKEFVSIESGPAPTALLYKRSIVKQYLGTDDPAQLSEMFKEYDGFLQACRDIKTKSNGTVSPITSIGDLYTIIDGMSTLPYIKDGKLNAANVCDAVFPKMEPFIKEDLVGKIDQWSPSYNAAYNDNAYCFTICPAWATDYSIKPNAPDQDGNLGLCMPVGGKMFNFGGTSVGIYKNSANKEIAWLFLNWYLLSESGVKAIDQALKNAGFSGGTGPLKTLYSDKSIYSKNDPFFGGQDILQFFINNMDKVNVRPLTKYDLTIGNSLGLGTSILKAGGNAEKCKEKILAELKIKLPELAD